MSTVSPSHDPEVGEHCPLGPKQDVRRLHVAVKQPRSMQDVEPRSYTAYDDD